MHYRDATAPVFDALAARVAEEVSGSASLEEAARRLVDLIVSNWPATTVLARTFATVPYGKLPEFERAFVDRLTAEATVWVSDRTPVLTLLATRGVEEAWNDRRQSQGHVSIPLASADHVDGIPMVASLMKSLGVAVRAVSGADASIVAEVGGATGLFLVPDAATTTDARGRLVIPAQDFVRRFGVRTVFGFGGAQSVGGTFQATVVFTGEEIPRAALEPFLRVAATFKTATVRLGARDRFFAEQA